MYNIYLNNYVYRYSFRKMFFNTFKVYKLYIDICYRHMFDDIDIFTSLKKGFILPYNDEDVYFILTKHINKADFIIINYKLITNYITSSNIIDIDKYITYNIKKSPKEIYMNTNINKNNNNIAILDNKYINIDKIYNFVEKIDYISDLFNYKYCLIFDEQYIIDCILSECLVIYFSPISYISNDKNIKYILDRCCIQIPSDYINFSITNQLKNIIEDDLYNIMKERIIETKKYILNNFLIEHSIKHSLKNNRLQINRIIDDNRNPSKLYDHNKYKENYEYENLDNTKKIFIY